MLQRRLLRLLCGLITLTSGMTAGSARPYRIDDMLRLEGYGEVTIQPGGRQLVVERLSRYDGAAAYPYGSFSRRLTSRVLVRDLKAMQPLRPLFRQDPDTGYWTGGFSPSGRWLVVYRLDATSCRIGLVDMKSRNIRWLAVHPALPVASPDPVWIDDDQLLLVASDGQRLPWLLDLAAQSERALPRLWQQAIEGRQASGTVIGSGADIGARGPGPLSHLLAVDAATGESRDLLDGSIDDFSLSSDHTAIAVLVRTGDVQPSADAPVTMASRSHRHGLRIVRLDGRPANSPCPGCDIDPDLLSWSPRAADLLFYARHEDSEWGDGRLYRSDGAGVARILQPSSLQPLAIGRSGRSLPVEAAWAGGIPVLLACPSAGGRRDWYALGERPRNLTRRLAPAASRLLSSDAHGLLLDVQDQMVHVSMTGRITDVARNVVRVDATLRHDPFRVGARALTGQHAAAIWAATPGNHVAIRMISGSRLSRPLMVATGTDRVLAVDPSARWLVSVSNDAHGTGVLTLSFADGRVQPIDRVNQHLADVDPAHAIALASGNDTSAPAHWLFLPPDRPETAKLPLIVIPYPGDVYDRDTPPPADPGALIPVTDIPLLAGHGYAVLVPSIPLDSANPDPADAMTRSIDGAVAAAIATGRVDANRVALWGHSFGGYAALAVATRSNRYRAIIASAADANLMTGYGSLDASIKVAMDAGMDLPLSYGWSESGQGGIGAPLWAAPDLYRRNSPLFSAPRIRTPLLLIQGDMDYVPVTQSEQMFAALYRLGRDATLLRYWGEGHVPVSPANIRDLYLRVFGWLDARLAGSSSATPIVPAHDQARAHASRLSSKVSG